MQEIFKVYREISYNIYTAKGNSPKALKELIQLDDYSQVSFSDLSSSIDQHIDAGYFFLDKLPCGRYVKSYRINEVCDRTLDILRQTLDPRILEILENNPRLLFTEFYRWLTTNHSSMMSSILDEFWHQFMTFSYEYKSWCFDNFDRFIHHIPTPTYERSETSPKDILADYSAFFRNYTKQYELDENILLYSLPLRLFIHENKELNEIIEIINQLSASESNLTSKENSFSDSKLKDLKQRVISQINRDGYAVLPKMLQRDFCDFMENLGQVINTSDIKINNLSNRKFNHHEALDLHTDTPLANYVSWYCINQDKIAGESEIIDGFQLLNSLPNEIRDTLSNTDIKFPIYKKHAVRNYPILTLDETGFKQLYYTSWLKNENYTDKQKEAIFSFEEKLENTPPIKIKLKPCESLIIDNNRMLHGRQLIPADSDRYLYRIHVRRSDVEVI